MIFILFFSEDFKFLKIYFVRVMCMGINVLYMYGSQRVRVLYMYGGQRVVGWFFYFIFIWVFEIKFRQVDLQYQIKVFLLLS